MYMPNGHKVLQNLPKLGILFENVASGNPARQIFRPNLSEFVIVESPSVKITREMEFPGMESEREKNKYKCNNKWWKEIYGRRCDKWSVQYFQQHQEADEGPASDI
jgi:hypothetical protein